MISQIPYGTIGLGIALICMGLAFSEAEYRGRIIILFVAVLSFILPTLFSSRALDFVCMIGRLVFGMGCYIYWKYKVAVP